MRHLAKDVSEGWSVWRRLDREAAWLRRYHADFLGAEAEALEVYENDRARIVAGGVGQVLLLHGRQHMALYDSAWNKG